MKKLFTFLAMVTVALSVSAQEAVSSKVWNFSDWDAVTYSATTVKDNLEVIATEDKTIQIDNNSKSIDDYSFTRRLKFGGTGKATERCLHFKVAGNCTITVYGMSASSSEERTLNIDAGSFGTTVATFANDGAAIGKAEYEHTGGATDIYLYSTKSGFNLYGIVVKAAEDDTPAATEYTVNLTSDPENNYNSGSESFDIDKICAALGVDKAGLATLMSADNNAVYIKTQSGDKDNNYTGNHNEFWMDNNGFAAGYSESGTCWYVGLNYDEAGTDEETGEAIEEDFYVKVGQMPNYFKKVYEDSDLSTTIYLVNEDKTITFNINLHVNAAEKGEDVLLSTLNIVKDYEVTLDFKQGKQYEKETITVALDGLYDALGTTAAELDASIADATYAQMVESVTENDETTYSLSDGLSTLSDAGTDGWFGRYTNFDEEAGKETTLPINAPQSWGATCTYYIQSLALAEGSFSFITGQYPGTMSAGATDYTYLYIVNGTNAARIKVQVNVKEAEYVDPDQWTQVGTIDITQEATKLSDYLELNSPIDNIEEVLTGLGIESVSDIEFYHLNNGGTGFDNDLSDGWGAWVNENGYFTTWGSDAAIMVAGEVEDGVYQISTLQIPTSMSEKLYDGVSITFPVYLVNSAAGKYYTVNFTYKVTVKQADADEWVQKYAAAYDIELISSEGYNQNKDYSTTLDLDAIAAAIGTSSPTLYGEAWTTNDDGTETMKYSDAYSCTPYPGFWMADDGRSVGKWGSTSPYGMTYANGVITYWAYPNTNNEGDAYDSKFYLVNEENGYYATITLHVEYVLERGAKQEEVGRGNASILLVDDNLNDDGLWESAEGVDWAAVCEALGIDESEIADCTWMVQSSSGKLVNATSGFEGENYTFDENGYSTDDVDNATFAVGFNTDTNKFTVSLLGADPEDGVVYTTSVALKSATGYYVFNLTIGSSLKGDVNEDGEVDIKDVVAIINHMAGTDTWKNANVNGDTDDEGNEIVDINDVVAVINIMAGNN